LIREKYQIKGNNIFDAVSVPRETAVLRPWVFICAVACNAMPAMRVIRARANAGFDPFRELRPCPERSGMKWPEPDQADAKQTGRKQKRSRFFDADRRYGGVTCSNSMQSPRTKEEKRNGGELAKQTDYGRGSTLAEPGDAARRRFW
jgi:hypothetical protein